MVKPNRIRDPIHNLIEFDDTPFERCMWDVVQSRPFQRLRRIRQNGFTEFVFPGATHTRFLHSIGVFHTARRLSQILEERLGQSVFDRNQAERALAAALVHDIGHGPFSHSFEAIGKRYNLDLAIHEKTSDLIVRESEVTQILNKMGSGFSNDVADIISGSGEKTVYYSIVSSQFDADRLDYIQRDRYQTGTRHASIDIEWLLGNLEIGTLKIGTDNEFTGEQETFVLNRKAVQAAEAYLLGLFQLYQTVYNHKAIRAAEVVFQELIAEVFDACQDGGVKNLNLPSKHPLVIFAKKPKNLEAFFALDDSVIWGAFSQIASGANVRASMLARSLLDRRLPKAIDVYDTARQAFPDISEQSIERATKEILLRVEDFKNAGNEVYCDQGERTPYRTVDKGNEVLNQIWIKGVDGLHRDIKDQSELVAAVRRFKFFRIYVGREDIDIQAKIVGIIKCAVRKENGTGK